jgi:hypothetical protein
VGKKKQMNEEQQPSGLLDRVIDVICNVMDAILGAGIKVVVVLLFVGVPLTVIYLLVRFIKWAWMQN